jgi:hypothetical protein
LGFIWVNSVFVAVNHHIIYAVKIFNYLHNEHPSTVSKWNQLLARFCFIPLLKLVGFRDLCAPISINEIKLKIKSMFLQELLLQYLLFEENVFCFWLRSYLCPEKELLLQSGSRSTQFSFHFGLDLHKFSLPPLLCSS